jgi:hypothetical protein
MLKTSRRTPIARTTHQRTCPQCGAEFVTVDRRQRFCSVGCARLGKRIASGETSPQWKGGRHIHDGYVRVHAKDHPRSSRSNPYVFEHILVMEDVLGRRLLPHERVHHKNGCRDDNRRENLELWHVKDPPGVRAADYHCFGCLCARAPSDTKNLESPEAASRISASNARGSPSGLNEHVQLAAQPLVVRGECAWCRRRFEPKTDTQRCCSRSCARYLRGGVLLRRIRARLEGRTRAPLRWIHLGIRTDTPACPDNALRLRAHPRDGANPSSSFGVDRARASPQWQTGRQSP